MPEWFAISYFNLYFGECKNLTSLFIGSGVTDVGRYASYECTSLTSFTIPNSVTSIGDYAFSGCSGLTDVHCLAEDVPETSSNTFNSSPIGSATLHVPASAFEAYKTTVPWNRFGAIVGLTEDEIDAIKDVKTAKEIIEVIRYDLSGRRIENSRKGLNIIRHSDGTARKVLVK